MSDDLGLTLTLREGETQTAFAIRCIKAEVWDEGAEFASPHSGGYLRSLLIFNPHRDVATPTRAPHRDEIQHWKDHAEEAGRGFSQVCKDYARVSARNAELVRLIEALADEWERDGFEMEAGRLREIATTPTRAPMPASDGEVWA